MPESKNFDVGPQVILSKPFCYIFHTSECITSQKKIDMTLLWISMSVSLNTQILYCQNKADLKYGIHTPCLSEGRG